MSTEELNVNSADFAQFSSINYSDSLLATVLQAFVVEGSKIGKVTAADLSITRYLETDENGNPDRDTPMTLESLLMGGTKIFDALLFLSMPFESRLPPDEKTEVDSEYDLDEIATDVFVCFFILLSQARPVGDGVYMGNFITKILGMADPPAIIASRLASFDLNKMNHKWIKHVRLENIGTEARNRFALGTAGYRLPGALIYSDPDCTQGDHPNMQPELFESVFERAKKAQQLIRTWLNTGLHWYAHPVTRSAEFITRLKSLNKAAQDLLTFLYTRSTLERMNRQRVIFSIPDEDPRNRHWLTWTEETFIFSPDPIFTE